METSNEALASNWKRQTDTDCLLRLIVNFNVDYDVRYGLFDVIRSKIFLYMAMQVIRLVIEISIMLQYNTHVVVSSRKTIT